MKRSHRRARVLPLLLAGQLVLSSCPCDVFAAPPKKDGELSDRVEQLEKEVQELRQIVQRQNETIATLTSKLEEPKGREPTPPLAPAAEAPKPKEPPPTLKDYIFGKPSSPPKEGEMLPLKVGLGSAKLGLLLQEWYVYDDHAHDNFRTRRAEISVSGKGMDHFKWMAMIDPSLVREDNATRSILKDLFVAYDGVPHHEVKLGQYKIPLTEEGFRSSALIDTIERSFIARTYSDVRDVGLMALGKWKYLDYQAGIFNGEGPNKFDTNDQKDVVARLVLKPFPDNESLKGFQVGSSGYYRATSDTASKKKRIGAEARYEYGPFSLKAEYLKAQDTATPANGWYAQAGYFFLPRWQGMVKVEGFDPNERVSHDREFDTTVGLNYFLVYPTTKLQLNYIHKDVASGGTPDDNQVVAAAQYAF